MKTDKRNYYLFGAAALLAAAQVVDAQGVLGTNLIVNGNAEAGSAGTGPTNLVASIPGWTKGTGSVNVINYDTSGYIASTNPAPPDHAFQYFVNGVSGTTPSAITQTIDVSSATSTISGGNIKFTLSGYLGDAAGYSNLANSASLGAVFHDAAGHNLATATIGPVSFNGNGLFLQQQIGLVPPTTTQIALTLTLATADAQQYGAADSLSLVLTPLGTSPGSVLGKNLVVDGNAEAGPNAPPNQIAAYIPGWSTSGGVSVAPYGGSGWISTTDPSPVDAGVNLFCGYNNGIGDAHQDIDVSAAASLIDAGQVAYQVSAWLGQAGGGANAPMLMYAFYDWTGKQLATTGTLKIPSPVSGMDEVSHADTLPPGTRLVHISLTFGPYYFIADDISFILAAPSGPPVIDPGGIVSASAFGAGTTVAQGSWIEIYGRNLASTTAGWSGSDFVNGVGPTTLQGVSVSIGGAPAYVNYVSPGQVDVLLPSNASTGPVPLTITNANGTSDPYYVQVNATQPSLLAPSTFVISGKQYVAAFNPDGSFALPANALVGVSSTPATPGQTIVMYGIGFGPVSDGITAGTLPTQQDSLNLPLVVSFGSTKATLAYAGLANGLTGLYQINVVVPQLPANNAEPITLTLGTTAGSQTLYLAVQ